MFYYTRCVTSKRVMFAGAHSTSLCLQATQLLSNKYRSGGKSLATLHPTWPAQDLNLKPPALGMNPLPQNYPTVKVAWAPRKRKKVRLSTRRLSTSSFHFTLTAVFIAFRPNHHKYSFQLVNAEQNFTSLRSPHSTFVPCPSFARNFFMLVRKTVIKL